MLVPHEPVLMRVMCLWRQGVCHSPSDRTHAEPWGRGGERLIKEGLWRTSVQHTRRRLEEGSWWPEGCALFTHVST
ncbi:hypothetical protein M3J09_007089 [Ascochyta lentis]